MNATIYHRLAPIYDVLYGTLLQPGRRRAIARLSLRPGESVLELGVGTGFGLAAYPRTCRIVGVDLSAAMIARARRRARRLGLDHVALCRMDAADLAFADAQFDAVYAGYLVNVVPDPVRVAREMLRVCRRGGRLVLVNHFDGMGSDDAVTRAAGRGAARGTGVNWALDFPGFVRATGLRARSN